MKVYFVNAHYDNGEHYEDHWTFDNVEKIFTTKEKAFTYINSLKPENMEDEDDMENKWENNPDPYLSKDIIKSFRCKTWGNIYETYNYTISEREVEE